MWIAENWKDYELLDCGDGEKLERWGRQILVRPDPKPYGKRPAQQCLAEPGCPLSPVQYRRRAWERRKLPEQWTVQYGELTFNVKPMNFKHTGLFPEQAVNWDFVMEKIRRAGRPIQVLNLFAYTGGATVACAAAGASVCHVDAAKGMVAWAKENARSSGLADAPIRWIVDDCAKFVERRSAGPPVRCHYHGSAFLRPGSFRRGVEAGAEPVSFRQTLRWGTFGRSAVCDSQFPYTTGLAPSVLGYILNLLVSGTYGGHTECAELGLPVTETGMALPAALRVAGSRTINGANKNGNAESGGTVFFLSCRGRRGACSCFGSCESDH